MAVTNRAQPRQNSAEGKFRMSKYESQPHGPP